MDSFITSLRLPVTVMRPLAVRHHAFDGEDFTTHRGPGEARDGADLRLAGIELVVPEEAGPRIFLEQFRGDLHLGRLLGQ